MFKFSEPISAAFCLALAILGPTSKAVAQSAAASACAILAGRVTPDISSQATSSSKFAVFKQIIQDDRYKMFDTANSNTLDIGITVVGYVDAFLGTTSNSNTWEMNWRKFQSLTYAQASSRFDRAQFDSRWSVEVIKAIVSSCPGTGGFYGLVETVTPGRDAFTISLHGTGTWKLQAISVQPSDTMFSCGGDEKATPANPIDFVNDHPISCRKDPNVTLLVTIRNSQRDVGPFTINSIADDLRIRVTEGVAQIDALRTEIQNLQGSIAALDQSVNTRLASLTTNINGQLARLNAESPNGYGFTNTEPANNGGGNNPDNPPGRCPVGSYVVGIQPYKATNGQRSIIFRCAPLPGLKVP
jgi:hypothetical protein